MEEDRGDIEQKGVQGLGLVEALTDWTVWWLAIAGTFVLMGVTYGIFFPTIAATMGYSPPVTLLLCVPPWVFGAVTSVFIMRSVPLFSCIFHAVYLTPFTVTPMRRETVFGTLLVRSY